MVWCYFMFLVSFVDWNIQSRLVGEYYVKSFVKTIFLLCVIIKGVFSLYVFGLFSVRRRRGGGHMLPINPQGKEVVLVSKIHMYSLSSLPFECRFNEIIILLVILCLAVIMTGDTTSFGTTYPWTQSLTQRNTHTGLKTPGSCPGRVSDIAV